MENISSSFILATALVERMLDVVALILVAIFSLLSIKNLPASFYLVVRGMEVIVVVGTIFIWIAPALEVQLINLMGRVIKNEAWYTKISGLIRHFLEGMRLLKDKRRAGSVFFSYFAHLVLRWVDCDGRRSCDRPKCDFISILAAVSGTWFIQCASFYSRLCGGVSVCGGDDFGAFWLYSKRGIGYHYSEPNCELPDCDVLGMRINLENLPLGCWLYLYRLVLGNAVHSTPGSIGLHFCGNHNSAGI
jgi:hypothetical protein